MKSESAPSEGNKEGRCFFFLWFSLPLNLSFFFFSSALFSSFWISFFFSWFLSLLPALPPLSFGSHEFLSLNLSFTLFFLPFFFLLVLPFYLHFLPFFPRKLLSPSSSLRKPVSPLSFLDSLFFWFPLPSLSSVCFFFFPRLAAAASLSSTTTPPISTFSFLIFFHSSHGLLSKRTQKHPQNTLQKNPKENLKTWKHEMWGTLCPPLLLFFFFYLFDFFLFLTFYISFNVFIYFFYFFSFFFVFEALNKKIKNNNKIILIINKKTLLLGVYKYAPLR